MDAGDEKSPPTDGEKAGEASQDPPAGRDQRIQFTPSVKPNPRLGGSVRADGDAIARRRPSATSIPHVMSAREKNVRRKREEEEKKHVDIDEHLMAHQDVAERYKTRINMKKPGASLGLGSRQADELLRVHGPNVLTPQSKRHPFYKFLDCLRSLFNLLLILAGVLEYILLGINFHDNFQNASTHFDAKPLDEWRANFRVRPTWEPSS